MNEILSYLPSVSHSFSRAQEILWSEPISRLTPQQKNVLLVATTIFLALGTLGFVLVAINQYCFRRQCHIPPLPVHLSLELTPEQPPENVVNLAAQLVQIEQNITELDLSLKEAGEATPLLDSEKNVVDLMTRHNIELSRYAEILSSYLEENFKQRHPDYVQARERLSLLEWMMNTHSDNPEFLQNCFTKIDLFLDHIFFTSKTKKCLEDGKILDPSVFIPFFTLANQYYELIQVKDPVLALNLKIKLANLPIPDDVGRENFSNIYFSESGQLQVLIQHFQELENVETDPKNLKYIVKAKAFFEQQLGHSEEELSIPRWYHATESYETLSSIIESRKLEMRLAGRVCAAWVASKREERFGKFAVVFSHRIHKVDPKPYIGCVQSRWKCWRGLQVDMPFAQPVTGKPDNHLVILICAPKIYKSQIYEDLSSHGIGYLRIFSPEQIDFMQAEIIKIIGRPNLTENWWRSS